MIIVTLENDDGDEYFEDMVSYDCQEKDILFFSKNKEGKLRTTISDSLLHNHLARTGICRDEIITIQMSVNPYVHTYNFFDNDWPFLSIHIQRPPYKTQQEPAHRVSEVIKFL